MGNANTEQFLVAAHQALKAFQVTPSQVDFVWQAENITFRVKEQGSDMNYVLRLHRPRYHTLEELVSERVWTEALAGAGVAIQIPLRTQNGAFFCAVDIPGDEPRFAGVTQWVEGELLSEHLGTGLGRKEREQRFHQIGALAAKIHNQSSRWIAPQGFERHALDLDGLMGEAPFWGRFWEHEALSKEQRTLLLRVREKIGEALEEYGRTASNFSMIHADLHFENILVHDGILTPIDFDDAGFGWHMYELAVAMFDEWGNPGFEAVKKAVLKGYRKHRPLTDQDASHLPLFLLIRGLALIGWVHQRPEHNSKTWFKEMTKSICSECEHFMETAQV